VFSIDPSPVCAVDNFGVLPLAKGLDPRDYTPLVFFHCHVRYDIDVREQEGGRWLLPKASIRFYVYDIIEPLAEPEKLRDFEHILTKHVGPLSRWFHSADA
jgi:hypothetical protein